VKRFPKDENNFENAAWIINGNVLNYGKNGYYTEIHILGHSDQDDGIWTNVCAPIQFYPNEDVLISIY